MGWRSLLSESGGNSRHSSLSIRLRFSHVRYGSAPEGSLLDGCVPGFLVPPVAQVFQLPVSFSAGVGGKAGIPVSSAGVGGKAGIPVSFSAGVGGKAGIPVSFSTGVGGKAGHGSTRRQVARPLALRASP